MTAFGPSESSPIAVDPVLVDPIPVEVPPTHLAKESAAAACSPSPSLPLPAESDATNHTPNNDTKQQDENTMPVEPPVTPTRSESPTAAATPAPASAAAHSPSEQSEPSSAESSPAQPGAQMKKILAASGFIDDCAADGECDSPSGSQPGSSPSKDDVEMSAEEEAEGLAEIKKNFLAPEPEDCAEDSATARALNRQLEDAQEEAELAALKRKFIVRAPTLSLGATLAAAARDATGVSSLTRQQSIPEPARGGKASFRERLFNAADEAHAASLAAARRIRVTMADDGTYVDDDANDDDDETIERRRKERAKVLAYKLGGKGRPAPRHITPTTMTTTTNTTSITAALGLTNGTFTAASTTTTTTTISSTNADDLQTDETLLLDSSTSSMPPPSLARQDSFVTSLASSADDTTRKSLIGSMRRTNVVNGASRGALLASRVAGPGKALPPSSAPSTTSSSTSLSFEKFNADLKRRESIKLNRTGSFLQRTGSNATSATLQRGIANMANGATDFSALLSVAPSPTAKSTSSASSSMGGHAAMKKAAVKGKAFVFRSATENSRDGFENEKSLPSSSVSRSGASDSTPSGPISFASFMSNAKRTFSTVQPSGALKRHSTATRDEDSNAHTGSALLNKLAKKQKI